MVIDRLSDECIGAIQSAHTLGNDIGLTVLRNEILFAGIVSKPERAASTLQKYSITYERVKESALRHIEKTGVDLIDTDDGTTGSNTDPLPFSAASKLLLEQALGIAEQRFGSDLVRSEHVLLALLGYNNGNPIESVPALDVLATIPNLKALDGKGSFSCFKFCEQLVQDLESTASTTDSSSGAKEEVRIGGSGLGLGTATLSSVGVDLTQMALDGQLDNVFGRDDEIRSVLRTLGRRRKNNPCLIGGTYTIVVVAVVVVVAGLYY
jgi:ATP-dependent Clp protease ATP-binding subunit ClpA